MLPPNRPLLRILLPDTKIENTSSYIKIDLASNSLREATLPISVLPKLTNNSLPFYLPLTNYHGEYVRHYSEFGDKMGRASSTDINSVISFVPTIYTNHVDVIKANSNSYLIDDKFNHNFILYKPTHCFFLLKNEMSLWDVASNTTQVISYDSTIIDNLLEYDTSPYTMYPYCSLLEENLRYKVRYLNLPGHRRPKPTRCIVNIEKTSLIPENESIAISIPFYKKTIASASMFNRMLNTIKNTTFKGFTQLSTDDKHTNVISRLDIIYKQNYDKFLAAFGNYTKMFFNNSVYYEYAPFRAIDYSEFKAINNNHTFVENQDTIAFTTAKNVDTIRSYFTANNIFFKYLCKKVKLNLDFIEGKSTKEEQKFITSYITGLLFNKFAISMNADYSFSTISVRQEDFLGRMETLSIGFIYWRTCINLHNDIIEDVKIDPDYYIDRLFPINLEPKIASSILPTPTQVDSEIIDKLMSQLDMPNIKATLSKVMSNKWLS